MKKITIAAVVIAVIALLVFCCVYQFSSNDPLSGSHSPQQANVEENSIKEEIPDDEELRNFGRPYVTRNSEGDRPKILQEILLPISPSRTGMDSENNYIRASFRIDGQINGNSNASSLKMSDTVYIKLVKQKSGYWIEKEIASQAASTTADEVIVKATLSSPFYKSKCGGDSFANIEYVADHEATNEELAILSEHYKRGGINDLMVVRLGVGTDSNAHYMGIEYLTLPPIESESESKGSEDYSPCT